VPEPETLLLTIVKLCTGRPVLSWILIELSSLFLQGRVDSTGPKPNRCSLSWGRVIECNWVNRNGLHFPILVFNAESDSVNNAYQWRSPFTGLIFFCVLG